MKTISINVQSLLHKRVTLTCRVHLTGMKLVRLRLRIAAMMVRVAARVAGVGFRSEVIYGDRVLEPVD